MKNNESSLIRFIKSSGIFFIGSVLSKAISILMLPLYTNRIPTDDMGYYDLSLTYITIATSFLFFDTLILKNNIEERSVKQKISAKVGVDSGVDSGGNNANLESKILEVIKNNEKVSIQQIADSFKKENIFST